MSTGYEGSGCSTTCLTDFACNCIQSDELEQAVDTALLAVTVDLSPPPTSTALISWFRVVRVAFFCRQPFLGPFFLETVR